MNTAKRSTITRIPLARQKVFLARCVWILTLVLVYTLFALSVPTRMAALVSMPLVERTALIDTLQISIQIYVFYRLGLELLILLFYTAVSALIFWSRSEDWMAILVSVALMTFGAAILDGMDSLSRMQPALSNLIMFINGIAIASSLLVLYMFPNGKFTPRWTRYLTWVWLAWLLAYALFPFKATDINSMSPVMKFFTYMISTDPGIVSRGLRILRDTSLYLVLAAWFGSGVFAQITRYKHHATPAEQQQSKWVVVGISVAFLGFFAYNLPLLFVNALKEPGWAHLIFTLVGEPIYTFAILLVPIFLGISISLYQLWDVDLLLNRLLVYGVLTIFITVGYVAIVFGAQLLFGSITGIQSTLLVVILTIGLSALFQPLRQRLQRLIDRRFYRERIDFRKAFTSFSRLVRTIIDLPELLRVLVERTTSLLHVRYGAVFLHRPDHSFALSEAQGISEQEAANLNLDTTDISQLLAGESVLQSRHDVFQLLVPLTALRSSEKEEAKGELTPYLVGVLALGPRHSGLGYSTDDRDLLTGLADQAGTAIYVAQLLHEREAEVHRRQEVERRLEIHRNSPIGQAELFAAQIFERQEQALLEFHALAQEASKDVTKVGLLGSLPNAIRTTSREQGEDQKVRSLASLAEAYNYFFIGQVTHELVPVGLRSMISQLTSPSAQKWLGTKQALKIYQHCYLALEANSIAQITEQPAFEHEILYDDVTYIKKHKEDFFLFDLTKALDEFQTVVSALKAYERVESSQDKLSYLASAVERLRHLERTARSELGSADRAIVQYVSDSWLALVTATISDLQTRARLVCQLLTRRTWQDDVVSVGLSIRNDGRGAALNIRVTLAPDPMYSVVEESASIERLAFGEEGQVYLRIRPRLEKDLQQVRIRFVVLYTDPRGSDQVENFADVIQLLETGGEFQFIPNPYVVGTPLHTGSPLFFGREDIFTFINENLEASHRNNLVLIGQRRTGKTSLLKQISGRLGDEYLPVYIDGQALGLDPGLANFFLSLATEIAFAMEDRGLEIEMPELDNFTASPAATFEHDFLARVRTIIGDRHLLIMLDEFEELETAVQRGGLEPSIFGFLRHLIQHSSNLSVIFCGTHRLEELASDYWNVLFNISIYRHISFLEREEAMRLIQEPVAAYDMRFDDLALDKIWRATAGHPYFLQLLCHSMVNQHNKSQRNYVTIGDMNAAVDEILASGEAHFVYLWTESTPLERLALTALSRMIPLNGQTTPIQVFDYLDERGISIDRQALNQAFHRLALRDVLSTTSGGEVSSTEFYRWKLGLLGMWVEKYKSMSRVVDEVKE